MLKRLASVLPGDISFEDWRFGKREDKLERVHRIALKAGSAVELIRKLVAS